VAKVNAPDLSGSDLIDSSSAKSVIAQEKSLSGSDSDSTAEEKDTDDSEIEVTAQEDSDDTLVAETGSKIVYTDGSTTTTYNKYARGDDTDGSSSDGVVVVGGSNRENVPPGAEISLSSAAKGVQDGALYSSFALGIVTTALLVFFHVLSLVSPQWLASNSLTNRRAPTSWLSPNAWELVAFVGFFQHINSISMLELTKAPYIVLDFTDSFAFVNFQLPTVTTETTRRLSFVILTGIVAFADRIGIDEDQVLERGSEIFAVVVAVLAITFGVCVAVHRMLWSRRSSDASSTDTISATYTMALKSSFPMCVLGLLVALWLVSIFPLTAFSTYEVAMQIRYGVNGELALALVDMWVVVLAGMAIMFKCVRNIRLPNAFHFQNFAVFGPLYAGLKQHFRFFFLVEVLFQGIAGGITGAVQGVPEQLVALLVVHLLFIIVVLIISPYTARWVLVLMVTLNAVKIINLGLAFAFLTTSDLSTSSRSVIAQTFTILNFAVILLIFVRQLVVFLLALKKWSTYQARLAEATTRGYTTNGARSNTSSNQRQGSMLSYDLENAATPSQFSIQSHMVNSGPTPSGYRG
jgi:hypothetical protein